MASVGRKQSALLSPVVGRRIEQEEPLSRRCKAQECFAAVAQLVSFPWPRGLQKSGRDRLAERVVRKKQLEAVAPGVQEVLRSNSVRLEMLLRWSQVFQISFTSHPLERNLKRLKCRSSLCTGCRVWQDLHQGDLLSVHLELERENLAPGMFTYMS